MAAMRLNIGSRLISALIQEVSSLLAFVARPFRRPSMLLVDRQDQFDCYRRRRRGMVHEATLDWADLESSPVLRRLQKRPIEVRLANGRVLSRTVQLPPGSREHIDAILRYQVERMTPWTADRVVYDYLLLDRPGDSSGQISIRLVAAAKATTDGLMLRLTGLGIRPALVGTSADPIERASPVNLLASDEAASVGRLRKASLALLTALFGLGVVTAGAAALHLKGMERQAEQLGERVLAMRGTVEKAIEGSASAKAARQIRKSKADSVPAVLLIDDLARVVPVTTYLTELSVDDTQLSLSGYSEEASRLIEILEDSRFLGNVRFVAPIIREPEATRDRFQIAAEIARPEQPVLSPPLQPMASNEKIEIAAGNVKPGQ